MPAQRPLPQPTAYSRPFWDAAAERRLIIQRCDSCGTAIMYPKPFCPHCLSDGVSWVEASGRGEIYTVTVQTAGPPSGFEDKLPYVIAVIRLDEGVQMMSNIVGDDATDAKCGDRVAVDFQVVEDGVTLPVFRLDRSASDRQAA